MQKISPFLWFDTQAEEAANFYVSIFDNSKVVNVSRMGGPDAPVVSVTFQLEGQEFMALNGGPHSPFTDAISFFVKCETQEEVDGFWEKLSEGGEIRQCGWLKDRFGLSWQIIPNALGRLLGDPDPATSQAVMQAMLRMKKIDIQALQAVHDGE